LKHLLATLLLALASPALSDEWRRYENTTYGFAVDIPPGLQWRGESGDGNGQDFTSPTVTLSLVAEPSSDGFEAAVREWEAWEAGQGWNVVSRMITPTRASVSARRAGWLMEMRGLSLCGDAAVTLQLEYASADVAAMQPIVERLGSSLAVTRRC
jgi:hypothetical protein